MDFTELQKIYSNKFVAILNNDKVVASGQTFSVVLSRLKELNLVNSGGVVIRFIRPKVER